MDTGPAMVLADGRVIFTAFPLLPNWSPVRPLAMFHLSLSNEKGIRKLNECGAMVKAPPVEIFTG